MRNSLALLGLLFLLLPSASSGQACGANCAGCTNDALCAGKNVLDVCAGGKSCKAAVICANRDACCRCAPNQEVACTMNVINPSTLSVVVQAQESPGLQSVVATTANNLTVNIPFFPAGTTDPITVTATKIDPNVSGSLALSVCSVTCRICDPVITLVTRLRGRPETQTFDNLPEVENKIVIENGNPGLDNLLIVVNGFEFRVPNLDDEEEQTIDVSSAMLPGNENVISFTAFGKPGGTATVVIRD